jgi:rhodanese-related sulfurtransferase
MITLSWKVLLGLKTNLEPNFTKEIPSVAAGMRLATTSEGRKQTTPAPPRSLAPSSMLGFTGTCALRAARPRGASSVARCCASAAGHGGRPVTSPTMVRARHILVESEAMIDSVREQIDAGKGTFDELAGIVSTCASKAKGGDLGWFRRNMMVKEFEEAAFGNVPGTVVKLKTQFGWHLLKVEEHGLEPSEISVREYADREAKGDVDGLQRIDCREAAEVEKASLPGFLNLPMGEYGRWADQFEKGELVLNRDAETVVMCHHGMRSANFCSFLSQQGFSNVRNLVGGIDAYSREIDDSVPRY